MEQQILADLEQAQQALQKAKAFLSSRMPFQGGLRISGLEIVARDKDGNITGTVKRDALATKQFAQLVQLGILATNETIKDTGGTSNSETTAATTGSAPTVVAGTSGTAATVSDFVLGTQTESQAGTINAYSGSGSSGSFTVTATITAGAARAYQEVGLVVTVNAHTYLICRDTFTTLNVSSGGTLSVTYTLTFS